MKTYQNADFYFYKILFIWKAEKEREGGGGERKNEGNEFGSSIPKCPQLLLGQANAGSWELDLVSDVDGKDLTNGDITCRPAACHSAHYGRELELELKPGLEPRNSDMGCGLPKWHLNYRAKCPSFYQN